MRNIKVLGLAIVAVLAMSAVVASAAQANQFMTEGNVSASIKASQTTTHKFTVDGSSVTCTTAEFNTEGEVASPAESVTVHPTYSGCTAFGFVNSTVTTTGCNYKITVGATSGSGYAGALNLECSGTSKITIVAGTCEATVAGGQEFGVSLSNSGSNVLIGANVEGIKVNKTKDGFLCPFSGTGETTGTYVGETSAAASGGVPITVEMT